jgi:hypothetical protein
MSQLVFAQAPTSVASRVAAQNALFDDAWQANLKMNPNQATAVGDYRYNDQLGDYSLAASAARHRVTLTTWPASRPSILPVSLSWT